jgi:hypothetical protein
LFLFLRDFFESIKKFSFLYSPNKAASTHRHLLLSASRTTWRNLSYL